ncbi:hypothetical protein Q7P37_001115 [Cladosporium fusiforme]
MSLYASLELCSSRDGMKDNLPTDIAETRATRERTLQKYPFLEYTLEGMLYHADSVMKLGDSSLLLVHDFPLETWSRLHNLFVTDAVDRLGIDVSREYIFAIKGYYHQLEGATRDECQKHFWDRKLRAERYTSLLDAARSHGNLKMNDMLMKRGAKDSQEDESETQ